MFPFIAVENLVLGLGREPGAGDAGRVLDEAPTVDKLEEDEAPTVAEIAEQVDQKLDAYFIDKPGKTRRHTDEVRARMSATQLARWAKLKESPDYAEKMAERCVKMSTPEVKEKMCAAQTTRWVEFKESGDYEERNAERSAKISAGVRAKFTEDFLRSAERAVWNANISAGMRAHNAEQRQRDVGDTSKKAVVKHRSTATTRVLARWEYLTASDEVKRLRAEAESSTPSLDRTSAQKRLRHIEEAIDITKKRKSLEMLEQAGFILFPEDLCLTRKPELIALTNLRWEYLLSSEELKEWRDQAVNSRTQIRTAAQNRLRSIEEATDKGPREKEQALKYIRKYIPFPEDLRLGTGPKKRKVKDEEDEGDG